jgi:hypothetical protein
MLKAIVRLELARIGEAELLEKLLVLNVGWVVQSIYWSFV